MPRAELSPTRTRSASRSASKCARPRPRVLPVHLKRHRPRRTRSRTRPVVEVEGMRRGHLPAAGKAQAASWGRRHGATSRGATRSSPSSNRARGAIRRVPSRHRCRGRSWRRWRRRRVPAQHRHRGAEPAASLREDAGERPDEGDVARPLAVRATRRVDAPDELGVEPEPSAEGEPAAVDTAERDRALAVAPASRAAHASGSRGRPRARVSTLVPPPG